MSATFCLSPKMLANLRAIRAGEPWPHLDTAVPQFAAIPPNFLVKGSPWRLTPDGVAVLALADERDALQATADLNAAMEKMEAALVEWSSGVQHRSGSEGCVKLWYDPAIGQFRIEGEDLRTAKRDRLVSAVLWWANPRKKPERAPEHKALSERCILAEDRVVALACELDALRKAVNVQDHLAMLPESSVQAMKDLGRNVQPESLYMVPDWAVEPEPDALGERPPMRLTRAGKAWLAERVVRMSNAADARVNALDNRVREVFTEPITAEEGIERLVRERDALRQQVAENDAYEAAWAAGAQAACARQPVQDCPYTDEALCKAWVSGYAHDGWIPGGVLAAERDQEFQDKIEALRKRVADFERLLTEPKVEQARLLALRDLAAGLYGDAASHTTLEARQDEILSAFPDVVDEALAANLHRRLNKGMAGALGLLEMQKDPKTGESYLPSWHDMPERVAALVREGEALREQVKAMTDERAALLAPVEGVDPEEVLRLGATTPKAATLRPRSAAECREGLLIYAAPLLAREVIRLRAALHLADEQSAEAIKRVSSEIVADKWNSTAELQAEVERLRARVQEAEARADNAYAEGLSDGQTAAESECDADHEAQPDPEKVAALKAEMERVCAQFEETRLTLLAEQGKPEGAPPGWSYKPGDPDFDEPGEWVHKKLRLKVWKSGTGWVWGLKERSGVFVGPSEQEDGQPARVVMLAATAAVK